MPGLEPGIQAAPSVIRLRTSALDARVKPAHDEAERAALIFERRLLQRTKQGDPNATDMETSRKTRTTNAQSDLPDTVYAFPNQRKEPLTDAQHVRNAVARFDQVIDVSDEDRALAFANIEKAAKYYNVDLSETSWHDLGVHPQRRRKEAAAKGAATRKREREERG